MRDEIAAAVASVLPSRSRVVDVTVEDGVAHVVFELHGPMLDNHIESKIQEEILRSMDIVTECRRQLAQGPVFEEVRGIVEAFYARPGNTCGGQLHVQLDDGNLEDRFLTEAIDDDDEAEALRQVLLAMPYGQRRRVYTGLGPDALEVMKNSLGR